MNQVNFSQKSTVELKAIAYDLLSAVQQYNSLLNQVNAEIGERARKEQEQELAKVVNLGETKSEQTDTNEKSPE